MGKRTYIAVLSVCIAVYTVCVGVVSQYRLDTDGWRIYSINDAYENERRLCNATTEMLHIYYQHLDAELDENGDTIARHNFFWDVVSEHECFMVADEIREGDWEDFFEDW